MGFVNFDLALQLDHTTPVTEISTPEEREHFSKLDHSNYMSLLPMKRYISKHLLSGSPDTTTIMKLLISLGERYLVHDMT